MRHPGPGPAGPRRLALLLLLALVAASGCKRDRTAQSRVTSVEGEGDYVQRYAAGGVPPAAGVAEYADHTSFPPRLNAEPSDEQTPIQPSPLDVGDPALQQARQAALAHPEVTTVLGRRFVETAIGAEVPAKTDDPPAASPTIGIEFFSYSSAAAVRASVVEGRVTAVTRLDPAYRPPETAEEVARAVQLVLSDAKRASLAAGTEPDGILTPCEQSVRCLYVQFWRDGLIALSAKVDMIAEQVFEVTEAPDADLAASPAS